MITNERQYKITNKQLSRLREAIEKFDLTETTHRVGSEVLANAELEALKSEQEVLEGQIAEYEALWSGQVAHLEAAGLDELPKMLIRARIAQHLSQRELAERLGLKEQQVQRYESEEYASASLRRINEVAAALKLSINEIARINHQPRNKIVREKAWWDWTKFPIKEIYRRGWFEDFTGSLDDAMHQAEELMRSMLPQSLLDQPVAALHRKSIRSDAELDSYALLAWEGRILSLAARERMTRPYRSELLTDEWIFKFIQSSSQPNAPAQVKEWLREVGIALVVEPYLPNTYLDGAAFLGDKFPVIGLTLWHDRLDNFWFVLLHELIHIVKHLRRGRLETVFDNLDADSSEEIEREADNLAAELLIPSRFWNTALPRYTRTPESIRKFANDLGIHPAIVAGRIRHEANNFTILTDLIGQNEVRICFPEAKFGA